MKAEKKIYALNGVDYTIVKGARWYVEYYATLPFGVKERKRLYGQANRIKDLGEREQKFVELIHSLQQPEKDNPKSALLEKLEEVKHEYHPKSYASYKSIINYFVGWISKPDLQVTKTDATRFIAHLYDKGLSANRAYSYRNCLLAMYSRISKENPFAEVSAPRHDAVSLMFFNTKQIEKIKVHTRQNDLQLWLAIQLLFYCYIRPGEMRLLRISDVNIEHNFIELRSDISKNRRTQKVVLPEQMSKQLAFVTDYPGSFYLFGKDGFPGTKPVSRDMLSKRHAAMLKEVRITGRYAFYSWKHTGVVKAVKAGINIKDLQLQLRHHSLDMVNEYLKNLGVMDSDDLRFNFPTI